MFDECSNKQIKYCRFRNLNSRCSITNTDLHLSNVLTEDEAPQDLSAAECDCSTPIVHLKTDILESESLSLLAETTYVDSVLTALPVCLLAFLFLCYLILKLRSLSIL